MSEEFDRLSRAILELSRRLESLELRVKAGAPTTNVIVMDKEHDRIMDEMRAIKSTYSDHQTWREEDRKRFRELKHRRDELRKLLGIKH